jgi:capsular exopolysaccharide synthesis family protein
LVVVAFALLGVAVAVFVQQRATKSYSATASVAFQSATLSQVGLGLAPAASDEAERELNTEVLTARSPEVARPVAQALHSAATPSELASQVHTESVPSANVLKITATTRHPERSARLANAFAEQYIAVRARSQLVGIEAVQRRLSEELLALPPSSPERPVLRQSLQRLNALRAFAGGGAHIVAVAVPPSRPSGVGLPAAVAFGLVGGLALALLLVFVLESLDRRVKTLEEMEREYGLPALAAIPRFVFTAKSAGERKEMLEPQRILRAALDFAAVTRELDTILVTSAVVGEGKTTVAVDLAHAVALAGRDVALVELDLRHPTFASQFDFNTREGLTLALTRGSDVQELLVEPFPELPNLSVLFSGPLPPNPSELIGSPKIAELIGALAWDRDMVIIDSPPLNPVADAQILLDNPAIHAVLMVARAGRTTREEARRARAMLERHMAEPLGLVITGLRDVGRYGYESHYAARPTTASHQRPLDEPDSVADPRSGARRAGKAATPVQPV